MEDGRLTGGRGSDAPALVLNHHLTVDEDRTISAFAIGAFIAKHREIPYCSRSMDMQEKPNGQEAASRFDEGAMFQRMLKSRTILLSGEIDKALAEKAIRQLILLEEEGDGPIRVFIDSPGGDADAGYALFDMLRFVKPPVTMIGMGLVASAAAIILLAAPRERRVGLPNSHYLIHQPMSGTRGVATEIEIHARELEKLRQKINRLIADETGQPLDKVAHDTDRDYWMTADEAVAYGLISRTLKSRSEL